MVGLSGHLGLELVMHRKMDAKFRLCNWIKNHPYLRRTFRSNEHQTDGGPSGQQEDGIQKVFTVYERTPYDPLVLCPNCFSW